MAETNEVAIYYVTATSDLGTSLLSLKRERPPSLEMIPRLGKCMPDASIDMLHVAQGPIDRPSTAANDPFGLDPVYIEAAPSHFFTEYEGTRGAPIKCALVQP